VVAAKSTGASLLAAHLNLTNINGQLRDFWVSHRDDSEIMNAIDTGFTGRPKNRNGVAGVEDYMATGTVTAISHHAIKKREKGGKRAKRL